VACDLQMLPVPHCTTTPAEGRRSEWVEMLAAAAVQQVSAAGRND